MSDCVLPLPCCDCCTHRLYTPTIEWSADVWRGHCGGGDNLIVEPQAVIDAWHHGDVYYLLAEIPTTVDGNLRWRYRAEAWSAAGERQWKSDWLITMPVADVRSSRGCIASDGTTVWVAIADPMTGAPSTLLDLTSTMFRLDSTDGAVLFSGDAGLGQDPPLRVEALQPDADGVLVCHTATATAFVSMWVDDVLTDVVGPPADATPGTLTLTATSVQHDTEFDVYYVGHTFYGTRTFADGTEGDCCKGGYLSKFANGELVWLSWPVTSDAGPTSGMQSIYPSRPLVRLVGDTLFFALASPHHELFGDRAFGAVDVEWGVPLWFRELTLETEDDDPADPCGLTIFDIDADDTYLWLAACRFVIQLDHDGVVVSTQSHVTQAASYVDIGWVQTVAADGAGNAMGGGVAAKCAITEEPERTSAALTCTAFSPGCDGGGYDPCGVLLSDSPAEPDYCDVHECGATSNNGRVALDSCTPDQWPPCEGPGFISWNCGSDAQTRTFDFVSECLEGGRRWVGTFSGGSVTIDWICGSGPEVTVVLNGCTVSNVVASYNCDGPFGYVAIGYTFDLDCGDCTGSGCGAFGADECQSGGVPNFCGCDEIPRTLTATIANTSCDTDYEGLQITLEYDEGNNDWRGSATAPNGKTVGLRMGCRNISSITGVDCTFNSLTLGMSDPAWVCGPPFEATFAGASITGTGCCDGAGASVDVVITE